MSRLAAFVAAAKRRVGAGAYAVSGPPLHRHGRLRSALASGTGIIAELKPRSPSGGTLLRSSIDDVLDDYRTGGAAALSILTDSDFFGGSPSLLRRAHAAGRPTLMKDFVVEKAQVAAAAHHGASAVLLIERILAPAQREALVDVAHAHGLEVLIEVHSHDDWQTAQSSQADLVGVNARDLETLHIDLDAQRGLLQTIAAQGRTVVALSGVQRRQDREAAVAAGAGAVLVGTSLMRQHAPALALRALVRPLAKVCGVTDAETLDAAAEAGADMVGLVVLSPQSPRDLPMQQAQDLAQLASHRGIPHVMVTSSADDAAVLAAARTLQPVFVQWHVAAGVDLARPTGAGDAVRATGAGWMPAVAPRAGATMQDGSAPDVPADADALVIDSPASMGGGTGRTHDWRITRTICDARPGLLSLVAGGLAADNAAAAVAATWAWGADASSRLESTPGHKDPDRVADFVRAVHGAGSTGP